MNDSAAGRPIDGRCAGARALFRMWKRRRASSFSSGQAVLRRVRQAESTLDIQRDKRERPATRIVPPQDRQRTDGARPGLLRRNRADGFPGRVQSWAACSAARRPVDSAVKAKPGASGFLVEPARDGSVRICALKGWQGNIIPLRGAYPGGTPHRGRGLVVVALRPRTPFLTRRVPAGSRLHVRRKFPAGSGGRRRRFCGMIQPIATRRVRPVYRNDGKNQEDGRGEQQQSANGWGKVVHRTAEQPVSKIPHPH